MPASARPNTIARPRSRRLRSPRRGRATASRSRAEIASRMKTAPPGPTSSKRWVAIAAPNCTLPTAPRTRIGAGTGRARPTPPSGPNVGGVRVLVVAALAEEVAHLGGGVDIAVPGVGKARAAAGLARGLADAPRPDVVVNVGTAGAVDGALRG